ncbi:MAG: hypothetical protein FJ267_09755, partial [Planctomycetes bacterium]|nr:hypothetical protein [Planctomycetota bacterium]
MSLNDDHNYSESSGETRPGPNEDLTRPPNPEEITRQPPRDANLSNDVTHLPIEKVFPNDDPSHKKNSKPQAPLPSKIGGYDIERLLGDGGFGLVYLGFDGDLKRHVAIKVPHRHRIRSKSDVDEYLKEAQTLASLSHASIVQVFEFDRTDDGLCFVVSKYIPGGDLAERAKSSPFTFTEVAELIAILADTLHYAHEKGVVHRDVKPANILMDENNCPVLVDFGIALNDRDYGTGHRLVGTVPYMSPEQLRMESHLVDRRSDIFSLGVVFYELLTGRRPFPPNRNPYSQWTEPPSPRQFNSKIPKELERICLKSLSIRLSDRYRTAHELWGDLR